MALATIVKTVGSSYRRPGAHMLIFEDGKTVGSISGGCLERDVIEHARKVRNSGQSTLLSYDTTLEEDVLFGVGLGCKGVIEILVEPLAGVAAARLDEIERLLAAREIGVIATVYRGAALGTKIDLAPEIAREISEGGRSTTLEVNGAEVFVEVIQPPVELFVFGAGYDAEPLIRIARELGFRTTVVDRRPAYATRERFPDADRVLVVEPAEIERLAIPTRAASVVMAHHYVTDRDYLRELLKRPLKYIGVMGPRRRAETMLQEFRDEGLFVGDELLGKMHNPVGLDIGAEGPEQIALAILSEINAVFAGQGGGMLREKKGPIHSPRPRI